VISTGRLWRRQGVRLRRHLTSWYAFVVVLGALGLASLFGLTVLRNQVEQRARKAASDTASVAVALMVHRNVTEADFTGTTGLTEAEIADLDGDVTTLINDHRLVGLEVWRSDGVSLYADVAHPASESRLPLPEQVRIAKGEPWIDTNATDRSGATWVIFLPYDAGSDGIYDGLVEVLIPDAEVDRTVATTGRQLYLLAIASLVVGALALMTLRRRLIRREHDASHDRLTGLLNWGGFYDAVQASINASRAKSHQSGALLLVDLDGFKSVNDTLGHRAGDTLLQQVANEIRSTVRAHDIVARLGGDEFAILLTGMDNPITATGIASQILAQLRNASFEVDGIGLGIEASIGVAPILTETGVDGLLSQVDIAMYRAKRTGKGVAVYDELEDRHDLRDLTLLGELRRAIDNDELTLQYQPKADVFTRDVIGVEALVRWRHPTRGLLAPDAFIPLAESTGLLGPLTYWVISHAIADAAHWLRGGLEVPVAVNISPRTLLTGDLTATIVDLLARHHLPPHLLEVEVTETAIMTDPAGSSHVLRQLRALGIRISIDDFGSGYTSLAYLRTLPIDALKIDRILITDMTIDDKGLAVTKSIIDLGHSLGLSVLAEGVETEAEWRQLELLGCDEIQGYLFARPVPAEHIEGWITAHQHANEHVAEPAATSPFSL
jgi:diguanylate cyclase (GGDEF)-like protein